jgi:cell division inhibitor SepF
VSSNATGVWQKTLVYLGLWEEPEAEPYDELHARDAVPEPQREQQSSNVRPLRLADERGDGGSVVRIDGVRTVVIEVRDFEEDCQRIVRHHRDGQPLLFDLAQVDSTTARRVLDVVSGMTFALRGNLSKVASRAFLLLPQGSHLAPEERARLEAQGYRFADGA